MVFPGLPRFLPLMWPGESGQHGGGNGDRGRKHRVRVNVIMEVRMEAQAERTEKQGVNSKRGETLALVHSDNREIAEEYNMLAMTVYADSTRTR